MKRLPRWLMAATLVFSVVALLSPAPLAANVKIGKAEHYNPQTDPVDFVDSNGDPLPITNQYLPLVPGTKFFYTSETQDGIETDEVFVTHETKVIQGVTCVVVLDTVKLEGVLTELTLDWYAQDAAGNVWYFGEDSTQYENGVPAGTEGSWEAGVDGALPGIVMPADPRPGDSYRQEYYEGEAEDMASVMRLNAKASVPYGAFDGCLETKEWSPLEPGTVENKVYAAGAGLVLVVEHHGKAVRQELVDITTGQVRRTAWGGV